MNSTIKLSCVAVAMGWMALLGGCRSYHDFAGARAQSAAALEALAEQGRTIADDDPDDFRRERFRYIQTVQGKIAEADKVRIEAMGRKMSSGDARTVEAAMEMLYSHLETMARMPARLKEDGVPSDDEAAALLEAAEREVAGLDRN